MHKPAYQLKSFSFNVEQGQPGSLALTKPGVGGVQALLLLGQEDGPDGHLAARCGRLSKPSCCGAVKQGEISSAKAAFHIFFTGEKLPFD